MLKWVIYIQQIQSNPSAWEAVFVPRLLIFPFPVLKYKTKYEKLGVINAFIPNTK